MGRIKILFTIPNFDTAGSGRVVYDIVNKIDRSRFEPEICCVHSNGTFFEEIESLGVPVHLQDVTTPYKPLGTLLWRVWKISRFFKRHNFDLIHSWHWSSDFTEPLAAKMAGIPFIYTKKAMGWGNKAWKFRSLLSSHIITINSDMSKMFFEKMSLKTSYIPIGIDLMRYQPRDPDENIRELFNILPDEFVIVSVANLVAVKGIELLLEAVISIDDDSVKIIIVGDDRSDYGEQLKMKYTDDRIFFVGKQLDVRPFLSVADLFVIPTKNEGRMEGLPVAPMEAMAMGILVIGSDIPGIRDLLKVFPDLVFEPGNIEDLVRKILRIRKMRPEEIKLLKNRTLNEVKEHYNINSMLLRHETLYFDLCQ